MGRVQPTERPAGGDRRLTPGGNHRGWLLSGRWTLGRVAGPLALIGAIALALHLCSPVRPKPDGAVRGVALGLFASAADYDYDPMLAEIADRGATDVLVVVPWYQADVRALAIAPRPGYSPADETVHRTLRQARRRGLRTALMPIVRLTARAPGEWRGVIGPPDVERWFAAYGAFAERMATLAAQGGAARFYVGSELSSMEPHTERWRALIAAVRARFGGRLSYSANFDHLDGVAFWDALDEVGLNAYFPMPPGAEPAALDAAWVDARRRIEPLAAHGKPIVFAEAGYPSRPTAAERPWDDAGPAPPDPALQARLLDGFCRAWAGADLVDGVYVWNWFGIGGPRDAGFTPRGKPAAPRVADCLRRWVDPTRAAR